MSLNLKFWGIFLGLLIAGFLGIAGWFGVQAYVGGDGISFPSQCPDSDKDGLNDCEETDVYFTEIYNPDTDGDGYSDGDEIANDYSPHVGERTYLSEVDSDKDGLTDDLELKFKASLYNSDTDGDGYSDFEEIENGYDPTSREAKKFDKSIFIDPKNKTLTLFVREIAVKKMNISVGSEESVPDGNFKIWYKRTRVWSQSQEQWLPYWMAFKGNKFGIHENVYGVRGSVELSKEDAEYLYNWAPIGTKVRIK